MTQRWHDLLFAHWPLPAARLRELVPPQFDLDTFDGQAWVGVVPFRMTNVRPRFLPALPWLSAFPELNVRTYVTARDPENPRPGVYFFSLEAANPIAVMLARRFFHLPYFHANMQLQDDGQLIHYQSRHTHTHAPHAEFIGVYGPIGPVTRAEPGTLAHWFTERYALYTVDAAGRAQIGQIHHLPWPLQPAAVTIKVNTVAAASAVSLPDLPPLLHFARRLDVLIWPLRTLEASVRNVE